MPVRIGVQVQPQHADYAAMRRAWREADQLGVDTIFNWDHFYPLYGDPDGKHFECLTTLGALAEATERAQVGSLVACNSYRNPQYLADAYRTVDHIAGGRAIFGVGAGWFQRDYDEYGYEFGTAGTRLRALARDLPLMKERLAKLNPPPLGRLPFLIGGGGEKVTLRIVAEHADMWHAFGDVEVYKHKRAVLERHCEKVGRDPSEIEHTWAARDGAIDEIEPLVEAGVSHFILGLGGPDYELDKLAKLVEWRDGVNG